MLPGTATAVSAQSPLVVDVVLQPPVDDEDTLELLILLVVGFLLGLYLVYDGFDTWQVARLIADTPTANVRSMAVGRTELEGVIRKHDTAIQPPYTDEACVYTSWKAERRERYTDDDGNTRYRWETIADGTEAVRFDLEDETGRVLVRADEGAEFDVFDDDNETRATYGRGESPPQEVTAFIRRVNRRREADDPEPEDDDGLFESAIDVVTDLAGSGDPLGDTTNRRRYTQTVVPIGSNAYVFGSAEPREAGHVDAGQEDLLEVRRDPETDEFLIADAEEGRVQKRYSRMGPAKTIIGLLLSTVTLYLVLRWYYAPIA